ncbi:MAG: hypothetical protein JOY86_00055 [Candidatus Eremiobacteraeota bacterium]|nr:hypothetical protein [Candidatus Eremiobacteraeota bacterium]
MVLALAFAAYHFLGNNWWAAGGVIVVYLVASYFYRKSREQHDRVQGAIIVGTKLSEEGRAHMGVVAEHNDRMSQRQAARK